MHRSTLGKSNAFRNKVAKRITRRGVLEKKKKKNYSRVCCGYRRGESGNGPTIPIINISRGFSEVHSSKEGTCTAGAFHSSRTLGTLFTFSDVYRLHIALRPKVLSVFECVRAHAGWFSSFFFSPFFSPSLRLAFAPLCSATRWSTGQRLVFPSKGNTSFVSTFRFHIFLRHVYHHCLLFEK